MNKKKYTFFEFCSRLRGRQFRNKKGQLVSKYILYWKRYEVEKLIFNRTEFKSEIR